MPFRVVSLRSANEANRDEANEAIEANESEEGKPSPDSLFRVLLLKLRLSESTLARDSDSAG
eukprot:2263036-Rhodomonas_salina.3